MKWTITTIVLTLFYSFSEWLSENKKTSSTFAKMTDDQIRILDDLPSSAVDLQVKDKVSVLTLILSDFFSFLLT